MRNERGKLPGPVAQFPKLTFQFKTNNNALCLAWMSAAAKGRRYLLFLCQWKSSFIFCKRAHTVWGQPVSLGNTAQACLGGRLELPGAFTKARNYKCARVRAHTHTHTETLMSSSACSLMTFKLCQGLLNKLEEVHVVFFETIAITNCSIKRPFQPRHLKQKNCMQINNVCRCTAYLLSFTGLLEMWSYVKCLIYKIFRLNWRPSVRSWLYTE